MPPSTCWDGVSINVRKTWYPKEKQSLDPAQPTNSSCQAPKLLVQFSVLGSSAVFLSIDIFTDGRKALGMGYLAEMSLIL